MTVNPRVVRLRWANGDVGRRWWFGEVKMALALVVFVGEVGKICKVSKV